VRNSSIVSVHIAQTRYLMLVVLFAIQLSTWWIWC